MLIVRTILLVIFSLLFIGLLFVSFSNTTPINEGTWSILGLFMIIILVLGPFWPSKEKIENSKFNLPTDNPKVAVPLFMVGLSLMSFYLAVNEWLSPSETHRRMVKTVYSLFGSTGVIVFWILIGFICLGGAYHAYKKYKTA